MNKEQLSRHIFETVRTLQPVRSIVVARNLREKFKLVSSDQDVSDAQVLSCMNRMEAQGLLHKESREITDSRRTKRNTTEVVYSIRSGGGKKQDEGSQTSAVANLGGFKPA